MQERRALVLIALIVATAVGCGGAPRVARHPTDAGERCAAATQRLAGSLEKQLTLELFVSSGVPALDAVRRQFERVAESYRRTGERRVDARVVHVTTEGDLRRARDRKLEELVLGAADGRGATAVSGFFVAYGSQRLAVPVVPPEHAATVPYRVAVKVRDAIAAEHGRRLRVGIATGKDEIRLTEPLVAPWIDSARAPTAVSMIEDAFPFYDLVEVDVRDPSWFSRDELAGMLLTQPGRPYSEAELERLDEFVMAGRRTLVIATSATRFRAPSGATPPLLSSTSYGGLERLLLGYGMRLHRDLVTDPGAALDLRLVAERGEASLRHPAVIVVRSFARDFAPFSTSSELVFPFPSSVELEPETQPRDVVLAIVASASSSAEVADGAAGARPAPAERRGIAAVAQGKLESAFTARRAAAESRVLLLGSAFFFTNPFAFPQSIDDARRELTHAAGYAYAKQHLAGMLMTLKGTLDWMTLDGDVLACASER